MTRGDGADIREAVRLHQSGKLREAEVIYRAILERQPNDVDAMHFLGLALQQMGRSADAWGFIERSIALRPADPRNHFNAAEVLVALEQYEPAVASYERSLELRPDDALAWHHLGIAYKSLGNHAEAMQCYRRAIAMRPDFFEAMTDLGARLQESGELSEAIECYRRALTIKPDFIDAINNLGVSLRDAGEPFEAVQQFTAAARMKPNDPIILINLAGALRDAGELDRAIATAQEVLRIRPDWEEARFNLGLSFLARGDYAAGWADCERRWEVRANRTEYADLPKWDDSELNGRTILLHAEDGFGDAIQFIRYAPQVADRGGRVLLRCQVPLHRLFSGMSAIESISANDQPVPACDMHCSLMALPRIFGTTLDSIPTNVPYLAADRESSDFWRRRLAQEPSQLKVGLAWAGSPEFRDDVLRSPHIQALAGLARAEDVRFYSIQKGYAASEARTPPAGMDLVDWTDDLNDFADTAGLISNLDLVISSDTAVVHLAGAMGKPVWVLLPFTPGCFWLSKRADSPWYPTMRLFRQKRPKSWVEPVDEIVSALRCVG